jgi:PKD repeat protein
MNSLNYVRRFSVLTAVTSIVMLAAAGCGLDRQTAPEIVGPSTFALDLSVTATPDTLVQDGESMAAIQVVAVDASGRPIPGLQLLFSGTSTSGVVRSVAFTASSVATDASGRAITHLIAPPAPATVPTQPTVITVSVMPVGSSFAGQAARGVQVRLMAPEGTPLTNVDPDAVIVADPRVANFNETIRFDASLTTDEGQACGNRCTYIWEFGDNTVAVRGITAEHVYTLPGTYTVTLTVTDDRGGVDTQTVDIRIIGPTPPTATFSVTPASPPVNTQVTFNASGSTVGAGATITQYAWNFGDGSATVTTSGSTTTKTYTAAGTYLVTLTVTDSLGRTATAPPATVIVTP